MTALGTFAASIDRTRAIGAEVDRARPLRLADLVLFGIASVVVADTAGASAAIGVQGLTVAAVLVVVFVLPYALITAELGSTWPAEGGLYVWVREAFGRRFGPGLGAMASWLYWIHNGFWLPSVLVLVAGTIARAFMPGLSRGAQLLLILGLIWLTVGASLLDLRWAKWIPNASAALNVVLLVGIGVLGLAFVVKHGGPVNSFSPSEWIPHTGAGQAYLPVLLYSFMGFELMSSLAGRMRDPRRDVPRAIGGSCAAAVAIYLVATFGILATVPIGQLSTVTGVADALRSSIGLVFGSTAPGTLGGTVFALGIVATLLTFVGNGVTWSLGCNATVAESGLDRTLPAMFAHRSKRSGAPVHALLLMGGVATVFTLANAALYGRQEDVFWAVFSITAVLFLLPYLLLFPAAAALRLRYPTVVRPFAVPGGRWAMIVAATVCETVIVAAVVLFFVNVPAGIPPLAYRVVTASGVLAMIAAGVFMYRAGRRIRTV